MRRFLIFCSLLACYLCCTDDYYNPVPPRHVYLEIDLTYRDKELRSMASCKIFTPKSNIILGKEYTGFAGVLVTHTNLDGYKAFDLACPHEVRADAIIEIDSENNAVCKVCGSKYEVINFYGSGGCISGPSKYPLRHYFITPSSGDRLIVRSK